jgi:hypothetical protein
VDAASLLIALCACCLCTVGDSEQSLLKKLGLLILVKLLPKDINALIALSLHFFFL